VAQALAIFAQATDDAAADALQHLKCLARDFLGELAREPA